LSSKRLVDIKITKFYVEKVPCEQQLLIELAINSGDFYVIFQRENHFINKRIQKPRRLNMKYIPAVNSVNKTEIGTIQS
jgi:hypothetical protein